MTKYLEGEEISDAELETCLHKAIRIGHGGAGPGRQRLEGHRRRALIDAIVHYLPSSAELSEIAVTDAKGKEVKLVPDAGGPLVARVFKTTADPFVGRLTYIRVLSGTLQGQGQAWNSTRGEPSASASCSCFTARTRRRWASSMPARSARWPS
jgi:elongation factor G